MRVVQLKWSRVLQCFALGGFIILMALFFLLKNKGFRSKPVFLDDGNVGNFEPLTYITPRGPGELGRPHKVDVNQKEEETRLLNIYGFNQLVSNQISLDRSIVDTREPECRHWNYPPTLPTTSVILVFHNEGWSTLLRTVHSVINRSPEDVLLEIILVDDKSDLEHIGAPLEEKLQEAYYKKVRLLRNTEREGLIRSRNNGAIAAVGEVLVFLDAHCEVNINWLPPLLATIVENPKTLAVPVIDMTDNNDFSISPGYARGAPSRGIFEWGLLYKESTIPKQMQAERIHNSEPYDAPTHAGGLFAINREWFKRLGWYDSGLLVWGGENYELSFKVWMCGGRSVWVPCSRVAHVYRKHSCSSCHKNIVSKAADGQPTALRNYKRVVETWFDPTYKEYFYTREPMARLIDMGDISSQLKLKKQLKCKSFDWFMKEVAYDVYDKYPPPPPNLHSGNFRAEGGTYCLDTRGMGNEVGVSECHRYGGNQLLRLNEKGQLANGEWCVYTDNDNKLRSGKCTYGRADGPWQYSKSSGHLYNSKLDLCVHMYNKEVVMRTCESDSTKWVAQELIPYWAKH